MSHFAVAVFVPEGKSLEEMLAPYQENNMGGCLEQYLEFFDVEEEYRKQYQEEGREMILCPGGAVLPKHDELFLVGTGLSYAHEVPEGEGYETVLVPHKHLFMTFDEFIRDWGGYRKDAKTGRYGYWENPNRKWDWYSVGGRWQGLLVSKSGLRCNSTIIYDLDFERMKAAAIKDREDAWDKAQSEDEVIRELCYGIPKNITREEYLADIQPLVTFAVITPDGEWHEKGNMGWFGMSSATPEDDATWNAGFFEQFLANADPGLLLVIVDCHI